VSTNEIDSLKDKRKVISFLERKGRSEKEKKKIEEKGQKK